MCTYWMSKSIHGAHLASDCTLPPALFLDDVSQDYLCSAKGEKYTRKWQDYISRCHFSNSMKAWLLSATHLMHKYLIIKQKEQLIMDKCPIALYAWISPATLKLIFISTELQPEPALFTETTSRTIKLDWAVNVTWWIRLCKSFQSYGSPSFLLASSGK